MDIKAIEQRMKELRTQTVGGTINVPQAQHAALVAEILRKHPDLTLETAPEYGSFRLVSPEGMGKRKVVIGYVKGTVTFTNIPPVSLPKASTTSATKTRSRRKAEQPETETV